MLCGHNDTDEGDYTWKSKKNVGLFGCVHFYQQKGMKSMKVRASVKPICEKCKVIRRRGKVMVICENYRHKQRQG